MVRNTRMPHGKYLPKHCKWCGRALVATRSRDVSYDTQTGEPDSDIELRCPRGMGFWSWFRGPHSTYTVIKGVSDPATGERTLFALEHMG